MVEREALSPAEREYVSSRKQAVRNIFLDSGCSRPSSCDIWFLKRSCGMPIRVEAAGTDKLPTPALLRTDIPQLMQVEYDTLLKWAMKANMNITLLSQSQEKHFSRPKKLSIDKVADKVFTQTDFPAFINLKSLYK
ncbi:hypothetical protein EMCRGX_G022423 [Ephydatia muelleri]